MSTPAPYLAVTLPVLAVLAVPAPTAGQLPPQPFEVGTSFPTLSLPSLEDGRPASIADFRGRKLILHIFASW
jgi:hypothetical protein